MNIKFFIIFLLIVGSLTAQDASRFKDEVASIQKKYDTLINTSKETIVFTGSSSIRVWQDLESRFPTHQIVNSGFGGSQASDLLGYSEELILQYNPKKVFIYEGDNDISAKKNSKEIIGTIQEIISKIWKKNSNTKIVLIAAKPSIARWNLKRRYKKLNRKFKSLSKKSMLIDFADVWSPMTENRKVKQDIFVKDGLHMNAKGYELWYAVIKKYMD